MRRLIVLAAVTVVLGACGGDGGVIEVDLADSGSTIHLDAGDRLELTLDANPSTGFVWIVDHAVMLDQVGASTHEPGSDLVGAPGITSFVFEATGTGEGELMLVYRRPWEDVAPEATFVIEVIVDA